LKIKKKPLQNRKVPVNAAFIEFVFDCKSIPVLEAVRVQFPPQAPVFVRACGAI